MRLDLYLLQYKDVLSVDIRLELLRQITEAIAYAHQKRVVHRALCPQSIFVMELSRQRRQIKILNWQVGYREDSSTTGGATAIALFYSVMWECWQGTIASIGSSIGAIASDRKFRAYGC